MEDTASLKHLYDIVTSSAPLISEGSAWNEVSSEITSSIECCGTSKWQCCISTTTRLPGVPPIITFIVNSLVIVELAEIIRRNRSDVSSPSVPK